MSAGPRAPTFCRNVRSSEGYPEGGDGSGRVASVVAEGSGEVDGPARLSTPIARLRRHAMICGRCRSEPGKRPRRSDVAHLVSRQATFALFDAGAIKRRVGHGQAARAR